MTEARLGEPNDKTIKLAQSIQQRENRLGEKFPMP
jgi:hypothetical protein